jgi:LAO/AO transport system kinase
MGDGIQAAKAGILEIGDVYVVNKADRDGAGQVAKDLRSMLSLSPRGPGDWRPRIVSTVAQTGAGIDDVMTAVEEHRAWSAAPASSTGAGAAAPATRSSRSR